MKKNEVLTMNNNQKITIKESELKVLVENVVNKVFEEQTQKRYVALVDFYVWANDDNDAINKTKEMCASFGEDDNQCDVIKLVEQPFGSMKSRTVYNK